MLKFAGKLLNNAASAGFDMASPYFTPTVSALTGNPKRAALQALGLTAGTVVPAAGAYYLGTRNSQMPPAAQDAFASAMDQDARGRTFLSHKLASDIQKASPTMTVNEAYYEAEKLIADALNQDFKTSNALIDMGVDQGDMWANIEMDPKEKYGVKYVPNEYPRPQSAYIYDREAAKLVPTSWEL